LRYMASLLGDRDAGIAADRHERDIAVAEAGI
jgi:hypothetical protein